MTFDGGAKAFWESAGWGSARCETVQADFSSRRFARLERSEGEPRRAILMQASAEQKTQQFIVIAGLLRRCCLSAPEIYASDPDNGLVLMEDFGDATFGKLLDLKQEALPLYKRAVDVLVRLHQEFDLESLSLVTPPSVAASAAKDAATGGGAPMPVFDSSTFVAQAELYLDAYFPFVQKRVANDDERSSFREAWSEALKPLDALPRTLMLRDFMPDNLMDLPKRSGVQNVGLLDFQDGGLGPMAYDLASLCECVRRDVQLSMLDDLAVYYHSQNPVVPLDDLRRACRVLSAQRHVRVLGIVVRLAEKQGRTDKLSCLPRMQCYLKALLEDEALYAVRAWMDRFMG